MSGVLRGARFQTLPVYRRVFLLLGVAFFSRWSFGAEPAVGSSQVAGDLADEDDVDSASVSRDREAPPSTAQKPAPLPRSSAVAQAPSTSPAAESGVSWEVPPIPWRGSLTLTGGATYPSEGGSSVLLSQSFNASGQSYVWQPWFLKLNGAMSLGRTEERAQTSSNTTSSRTMGGGGSVLPATRYPFSFTGSVAKNSADSRPDTGAAAHAESQTTTLGLTQIYSPLSGGYASTWSYNRLSSEIETANGNGNGTSLIQGVIAQGLAVDIAIPIRTQNPQSLTFNTSLNTTNSREANAKSRVGSVNAAHSIYLEDYVLTWSTNVSANSTNVTTSDEKNRSSFSNLTTTIDWIPSDDYPISVGANGGVFTTKTGSGSSSFSVSSSSLLGSIRYPMDKHWNFFGQASVVQSSTLSLSEKTDNRSYSTSAGASWSGDGVFSKWRDWDYSLSYGTGAGISSGGSSGSAGNATSQTDVTGNINLSQSLLRRFPYAEGAPITLNLSQGYGAAATSEGGGVTQSLNHSAGVSWVSPAAEAIRKQLTASISDGRSFGTSNQYFQQAVGNALLQSETGPYSTVSGQGSLSYSRQGGDEGSRTVFSASAGARYSHARFANVSGLSYDARYDLIVRDGSGGVSSNGSAFRGLTLEHLVTQGWSWRFGLLGWKLEHTVSKFGSQGINQSVFVSVVRDFSGVL